MIHLHRLTRMSKKICNVNFDGKYSIFTLPASLNQPRKRWRLAFTMVYCSRAFQSLLHREKKGSNSSSETPSFIVVDVEPGPPFSTIDLTSLTAVVKGKNSDQLLKLGGVEGVANYLNSHVSNGIHGGEEDVARRRATFGSNTYLRPPSKSFIHFVLEAFNDLTILILLSCAGLSLGFGIKDHGLKEGCYDGGSILIPVFLDVYISALNNLFCQNRQFEKLSKVTNKTKVEVVRDGDRQQISVSDVVVGDVVCLKIGIQVPADGLFLAGHSLQVLDESSMTRERESDHVEVNSSSNPFLFSGTKVADGYGQMLVTSVGMNTTWGEMMSTISPAIYEQTPFQARLDELISKIDKVRLVIAFLLLVLVVHHLRGNQELHGSKTKANDMSNAMADNIAQQRLIIRIITTAITIILVIPEGFPLAIILMLDYSKKKIMADHAMVRNPAAWVTMGVTTTICIHKTGTLSLNEMQATKFWLGKDSVENFSLISENFVILIQQGVALNTTGGDYRSNAGSEFEFSGSPTEKAILSWAVLELGMNLENIKQNHTILHVEAFNSEKKRSGVLTRMNPDNEIHVHWKGAAEMILALCSTYCDASGSVKTLDHDERKTFEKIIQGMAASSLRCIAFAHKQILGKEQENLEDSLTLIGFVGMKDPCRQGVRKAMEDCQLAGVDVKLITCDNVFNATAIAAECGILKANQSIDPNTVVEGEVFRNYTPEERMQKVDKICVMARSSPFDKLLMVQCLKQKGNVVAVTGDGTNDAPALKEADIGLSMGIQGAEVAKESSDIIILDDNFASVATVLRWGRCVYTNIQKFIQFQLTVYVAALVINLVAAVSAGEVPLSAIQIFWVILIMDTLGALALATEQQPTEELMDKPPVGQTEPLISNVMWRNLLGQALYQTAVLLPLHFRGESILGVSEKVKDTLVFNTFVFCQIFNLFNARQLEKKNVLDGLHKNKMFLGIIGITIILQVIMVEFLKKFADMARLNWGEWGACIGIAAASWPISWVVKCIYTCNEASSRL